MLKQISGRKKTWVDIMKMWPPFFRAPVGQWSSCSIASQSDKKNFLKMYDNIYHWQDTLMLIIF